MITTRVGILVIYVLTDFDLVLRYAQVTRIIMYCLELRSKIIAMWWFHIKSCLTLRSHGQNLHQASPVHAGILQAIPQWLAISFRGSSLS